MFSERGFSRLNRHLNNLPFHHYQKLFSFWKTFHFIKIKINNDESMCSYSTHLKSNSTFHDCSVWFDKHGTATSINFVWQYFVQYPYINHKFSVWYVYYIHIWHALRLCLKLAFDWIRLRAEPSRADTSHIHCVSD